MKFKMIDIDSFNRSLKAFWIKKYLHTENRGGGGVERFFSVTLNLGNMEAKSLNKAKTKQRTKNGEGSSIFKVSDSFKEILKIWLEVNFKQMVTSDDHFLASPLCYNSPIRTKTNQFSIKTGLQMYTDYTTYSF